MKKLRRNGAPAVPLHTLIRDEVARHNATHPDSTAQAFVWLKRILNFMSHFFDTLDRHPDLELNGCLTRAYEAHLGPYHNVVFRQLAVVLMQVIPDRAASSLIKVWSGTAGAPFLLNFFTLPSTSFAAAAWIAEPKAPKVGMRAWMPSMKGCAWTG